MFNIFCSFLVALILVAQAAMFVSQNQGTMGLAYFGFALGYTGLGLFFGNSG